MNRELLRHAEFTIKPRDLIKPKSPKVTKAVKPLPKWKKELLRGAVAIFICFLFWVLLKTFVVGYFSTCTGGQINSIGQFTKEFTSYWNSHDHY